MRPKTNPQKFWAVEIERERRADRRRQSIEQELRQLAKLVATGQTLKAAAESLGLRSDTYSRRKEFRDFWNRELAAARAELEALGLATEAGPSEQVQERIRRATALLAGGQSREEVATALGVEVSTLEHYQRAYAKLWKEERDRALQAALLILRAQAGTDKVLEDPELFLRRALIAEKWARASGRELFPAGVKPTLLSFFESYYRPVRLSDASPETLKSYQTVLKYWRLLTGDPPLSEVTAETLARHRDCLAKLRGKDPVSRLSRNSVARHLSHLQAVLDKAGPPGFRNRDAQGIIDRAPWIRRPVPQPKEPRFIPEERFNACYAAAAGMTIPDLDGFKPAAWWRALLVAAFNTQLRRRSLFEMRMADIDWTAGRLTLAGARMKTGRWHVVHLNAITMEHLRRIRTDRELVFPWPHHHTTFWKTFHRLQDLAGIPAADHFGLHDIRKTAATVLWEGSPQAAQLALGHSTAKVTMRHYVQASGIVARALDALPQPAAFLAGGAITREMGGDQPPGVR